MINELIFCFCIFSLIYIYLIYYLLLNFLNKLQVKKVKKPLPKQSNCLKTVSIGISAYNEEKRIEKRINNIISLEYQSELLEIFVASDGSSDHTVKIAKGFDIVRVLDFEKNRGRAEVQNNIIAFAKGDIIVFTDAETEFQENFLLKIIETFSDPSVGCAVGNLVYLEKSTAIGASEGMYWRFEKKIRKLESDLGILATATGACMAVRKDLWRTLAPIDDSDFTTPLDVILQGRRVVYVPEAVAYDVPPSSMAGEFRTRVRQTSKNLVGTLRRWGWSNWLRYPAVSWGLLSHKLMRWLTAFFMLGALVSNLCLLDHLFYRWTIVLQGLFYLLGAVGFAANLSKRRIPVASTISSFCVAIAGMGVGVLKGLMGGAPAAYRKAE